MRRSARLVKAPARSNASSSRARSSGSSMDTPRRATESEARGTILSGIARPVHPGACGPVGEMKREILMSTTGEETRVAILEDDLLVELLVERPDSTRIVGDIYLGKVEAVLPGIQAAFVDIGTDKAAFLHVSDVASEDESGEGEEVS